MLKFEITMQMANVIMQCLGEAPAKLTMPVILELQRQLQAQQLPPQDARREVLGG